MNNKRVQVIKSNLISNCNYLVDRINAKNINFDEEDEKFIILNPFIISFLNNFNEDDTEDCKDLEALDKWISYLNYKYNTELRENLINFYSNSMSSFEKLGLIFK
jgi:hypothetical protein